jgi:hypothetical protein
MVAVALIVNSLAAASALLQTGQAETIGIRVNDRQGPWIGSKI